MSTVMDLLVGKMRTRGNEEPIELNTSVLPGKSALAGASRV